MPNSKTQERKIAEQAVEAAESDEVTEEKPKKAKEKPTATETAEEVVEITQKDVDAVRAKVAELMEDAANARAEAAKAKSRADDLNGMASRLQADFDNYRRRTEEAGKKMRDEGIADVLTKLLSVVDVIDRALAMIPDEKVAEGVRMIARSLDELLAGYGAEEIEALGKPFDPKIHNAIMRAEAEGVEEGTVTEVFNKGYRLGDKLLRAAVVKVAG